LNRYLLYAGVHAVGELIKKLFSKIVQIMIMLEDNSEYLSLLDRFVLISLAIIVKFEEVYSQLVAKSSHP